ncbi:MAG: YihY family inner membrane protein [Sneathiellaceae bacterium]
MNGKAEAEQEAAGAASADDDAWEGEEDLDAEPAAVLPEGADAAPAAGAPDGPARGAPARAGAAFWHHPVPLYARLFVTAVVRRFLRDNGPQVAASLTYTSLLSMVPVLALSLAIVAVFPPFAGLRGELSELFTKNFLPGSVVAIEQYLETFTRNAGQLTAAGLIGLVVTAILMFVTIENAFNRIWRVPTNRSFVVRLMAFWTLMSLGPLIFGFSISISTSVSAAVGSMGATLQSLAAIGPPLLTFFGFLCLYWMLPNYPVRWQHAAAGAVTATLLFEGLRLGFGSYIQSFPTYQLIYGALSMIPILLVWTYLAWCVAIVGAVVAAVLPNFVVAAGVPEEEFQDRRRLEVGMLLLDELRRCSQTGMPLRLAPMVRSAGLAPDMLDDVITRLVAARIVLRKGRQELVLCRDLRQLRLYDLVAALRLLPGLAWRELPHPGGRPGRRARPWATDLQSRMLTARGAAQDALSIDLDTFLAQYSAEATAAAPRRGIGRLLR